MKKIFTILLMSLTVLAFGQVPPSDAIQFQTFSTMSTKTVKPTKINDKSINCGSINFTGNLVLCDSGSTVITATGSACGYEWFADPLGVNSLSTADTLASSVLYNDTAFYCRTICSDTAAESLMGIPPHGSVFNGNQRGYWFQAPTDFIITGLRVPTEANPGAQTLEILRFTTGPPPLWAGITNAFVSLGYWNNSLLDTIPTCITVDSGDYIGIYGSRQGANSYATGNYNTTIAGFPVTLGRSGMQFALNTNQMQDVFSEASGSISRTEMIYTTDGFDTTIAQVDIVVNQSSEINLSHNICDGDSILLGGSYQNTAALYYDSLQTVQGCDSIIVSNLTVNVSPTVTMAAFSPDTICSNGVAFALPVGTPASGIYTGSGVSGGNFDPSASSIGANYILYTFTDTNNCSSADSSLLIINSLPTVTMAAFSPDTVCSTASAFVLPSGTPAAGIYTGSGVSGSNFDPSASNIGANYIIYTFTDTNNCSSADSALITVELCTNVEANNGGAEGLTIFPNPVADYFTIQWNESNEITKDIILVDALGKTVKKLIVPKGSQNITVDCSDVSQGIYFVILPSAQGNLSYKITKK